MMFIPQVQYNTKKEKAISVKLNVKSTLRLASNHDFVFNIKKTFRVYTKNQWVKLFFHTCTTVWKSHTALSFHVGEIDSCFSIFPFFPHTFILFQHSNKHCFRTYYQGSLFPTSNLITFADSYRYFHISFWSNLTFDVCLLMNLSNCGSDSVWWAFLPNHDRVSHSRSNCNWSNKSMGLLRLNLFPSLSLLG